MAFGAGHVVARRAGAADERHHHACKLIARVVGARDEWAGVLLGEARERRVAH